MRPQQPLAVFDLDGTLTDRDSFLPFLWTFSRRAGRLLPLWLAPLWLALYACRLVSDRKAKEGLLRLFIGNRDEAEVAEHARWFARHWVAGRLRPRVVARLREHQDRGDRTVLLSASPDVYVPEIAGFLGFDECVCTQGLGLAAAPNPSWAYGDSPTDSWILRWATCGYRVEHSGRLRQVTGPCFESDKHCTVSPS